VAYHRPKLGDVRWEWQRASQRARPVMDDEEWKREALVESNRARFEVDPGFQDAVTQPVRRAHRNSPEPASLGTGTAGDDRWWVVGGRGCYDEA